MVQRRFNKSEINPVTHLDPLHNGVEPVPPYLERPQTEPETIPQFDSRTPLLPQTARALLAGFSLSSPWLIMGVISCSLAGAVTLVAFWSITRVPPSADCAAMPSRASDRQVLQCAQEAARSGELSALLSGLALLGEWTGEDPLYTEAQEWLQKWSESVLAVANQQIKAGHVQRAIELVVQIPESSPSYAAAQAALANWRQADDQMDVITAEVHEAMKRQDWTLASERITDINALSSAPGRSQRVTVLLQQLADEKQGRRQIAKARELAKTNDLQKLRAAVEQLGQINPETDAWEDIQTELNLWGKTLLDLGATQWRQGNSEDSLAIAEQIIFIHSVSQEARQLMRLSQADILARSAVASLHPTPIHLLNLMEAVAAVRQISPDSQFYSQAQTNRQNWEQQLKDVAHLQIAQLSASLGAPTSFNLAIGLAEQIAPERPRRTQAQTLIDHWRTEIERLDDRPYLLRAQQLAEPGTIPALQSAIVEASKVRLGRPARKDAQAMIYDWNQEIETIEDQPLLTQAQTLAQQGKLLTAIQAAAQIQPGRALHPQAQAAIQDWRRQVANRQRTRRQARQRQAAPRSNAVIRGNRNRDRALQSPTVEIPAGSYPAGAATEVAAPAGGNATPTLDSLLQSLPANTAPPSLPQILSPSAPPPPVSPTPTPTEAPSSNELTPPSN